MNELQPNEQPLGKLPPETVFLQCGDISSKNVQITTSVLKAWVYVVYSPSLL